MVGGGLLAQAGDGRGEGGRGVRVAVASRQAGAGQVAFGPQHRGQVPRLVVVEQGEQLTGGDGVIQVVGGAGGQRPRPPQAVVADSQGARVGEEGLGEAECGARLAAGGGGEALDQADWCLVLGVFAGPQVAQAGEDGLGGRGVAA